MIVALVRVDAEKVGQDLSWQNHNCQDKSWPTVRLSFDKVLPASENLNECKADADQGLAHDEAGSNRNPDFVTKLLA